MFPKVSVVIPVYNKKNLFKEAIQSVLNQTYNDFEIIVIDDGSTEKLDDLKEMKDERVRYYKNANHGVSYSRNFGMNKARGKYIAFLDSDDFWDSCKLERQVELMEKTNAKWSQHSYYYYDNTTKNIVKAINTYVYKDKVERCIFCSFKVQTSCFMVETEAVKKANAFFDEKKAYGEDDTFYRLMASKYPLMCINEYLGYFRIHENNAGFDIKKQIFNRASIWEEIKNDSFFKRNTTLYIKAAYLICSILKKIFVKMRINSKTIYCFFYFIPWSIFQIENYRLCKLVR